MTGEYVLELSRECAASVWSKVPPNARYAEDVAMLLMETAATESGFVARRQGGFGLDQIRGAWGLWQTEAGSARDGMAQLLKDDALRERAAAFLFGPGVPLKGLLMLDSLSLLRLVHDWDRLAVLLARLHYFRKPGPVPGTILGRAAYYKEYYNTAGGSGSVKKYMDDYRAHVLPVVDLDNPK